MEIVCTPLELRVLGSLIEKEMVTPEYYPMSLNSLTNACNQKTNRDPVMSLAEDDVREALDSLREKRLAWQLSTSGGRVPKFEHNIRSLFTFSKQETALLCVLILRGPQTPGELRARTERMASFSSLEELEGVLQGLMAKADGPFVAELPRKPGHKEARYVQRFSANPEPESNIPAGIEPSENSVHQPGLSRIDLLEKEIGGLRVDIEELKKMFQDFRRQFE